VIVVDTNIIAYLMLPGEQTQLVEQVMAKDNRWLVPPLWQSEFRNVLALLLRQGKITIDQARAVMTRAERLLNRSEQAVISEEVLLLVNSSRCSAYDCEFVSLAKRSKVSLVTADKRVLREFPATAVSPQQFIGQ
jgi:predicted nucleic acid-binding protein